MLNDIVLEDAFGQPGHAHVSEPEFTLEGDGAGSVYTVRVNVEPIGHFTADDWGNVHIKTPPLADGEGYELEWNEVSPTANENNGRFKFQVDTKRPTHPTITTIVKRNGSLLYDVYGHTANMQPFPVHIIDHKIGLLIGGAMSDENGEFFAAVKPWNVTHRIHAVTLDLAGNVSTPSPAKSLPK